MSTQIAGTARPDSAKGEGRGDTKEMTGRLVLCDGQQAISSAERIICGNGAVDSPAQAYGLALSGQRAAGLLAAGPELEQPMPIEGSSHRCVYHRWPSAPHPTTPYELFPATAQEAADLSLVAHVLSSRSGEAVTCRVDKAVASKLGPVRLFNRDSVEGLLEEKGSDNDRDALSLADAAFRDVALALRRQVQSIACYQTGDAEIGLIALGADMNRATAAVDQLRKAGVKAGMIGVTLREPFPAVAVKKALGKIKALFVVLPPRGPQSFLKSVRGSLGKGSAIKAFSISDASGSPAGLAATVASRLPSGAVSLEKEEAKPSTAPVARIGSTGAGEFGMPLLFEVARNVARVDSIAVAHHADWNTPYSVVAISYDGASTPPTDGEVDVLLAPYLGSLDADAIPVREGGAILLVSSRTTGRAPTLGERVSSVLVEKKISLFEVSLDAVSGSTEAVQGALLHVIDTVVGKSNLDRIVRALTAEPDEPSGLGELLSGGAKVCRTVALDECTSAPLNGSQPPTSPATEPAADAVEQDGDDVSLWRNALRHFHVKGEIPALPAFAVGQRLVPVSGRALYGEAGVLDAYPYVFAGEDSGMPWVELLANAVSEAASAGVQLPIIERNLNYLASLAAEEASSAERPIDAGQVYERSIERFAKTADLSEAGATSLAEEIGNFAEHAPKSGTVIGFSSRTLFDLLVMTQRTVRSHRRGAFQAEVRKLTTSLRGLLRVDDAQDSKANSPEMLAAALGKSANQLFDSTSLSQTVLKHTGSTRLGADRRGRVEQTLAKLETYLGEDAGSDLYLLHRDSLIFDSDDGSVSCLQVRDALTTAIGFFDGHAARMLEVFRAMRVARLEAAGEYDPQLHELLLARLSWEACDPDELAQLPVVAVYENAAYLAAAGLGALSSALRSGRPIRILAVDDGAIEANEETDSAFSAGLGLLAISHREAFVLQSTSARPGHLARGLKALLGSDRPSVAIVATTTESGGAETWLRLAAAHEGRGFPCFAFDPEKGDTWASRFDLSENAQPGDAWPSYELPVTGAGGEETSWTQPLTYADAAALDPAMRDHFLVLPETAWSDEQIELSEYLTQTETLDAPKIPFIWVVDTDGTLRRAVITRALTFASWVRMRMWRMLQELAGINNAHVIEAAETVKEQMLAEVDVERQALAAEHDAELDRVRNEAAQETMERLVSVLLDENFTAAAPSARLPAAPAAEATAASVALTAGVPAEEPPPAAEEEDDGIGLEEACIDSFLCTTCNECTNLNSALFKYDDNKQAVFGDLAAGTFQQLVVAAEKCPARCIHPGAPRSDDSTATPELVQRAAPFN